MYIKINVEFWPKLRLEWEIIFYNLDLKTNFKEKKYKWNSYNILLFGF